MSQSRILLILAAVILTACSQDDGIRLKISARAEKTRAVLNGDKTVSFSEGDMMTVFDGSNRNNKFTAGTVYEDGSADFIGGITTPADDKYIAVYPYRSDCAITSGGVKVNIPNVQTAIPGTFDPTAAIFMGQTGNMPGTGCSLTLKNVCALVKFGVPEGTSYAAAVLIPGGECFLTGEMVFSISDEPSLVSIEDYIDFAVTLQGNITAGNWYYMAVNPAVLSNGFALYLFDSVEDAAGLENFATLKATEKTVVLHRGEILNLGIIGAEPGASFEIPGGTTTFEW